MASSSTATWNDDHNHYASSYAPLPSSQPPPRPSVTTDDRRPSPKVVQQLPTGSVVAFETLASLVTNNGAKCHPFNWWASFVLVTFLTVTCVFFSLTDSFVYNGKEYYGVAWPLRLFPLNLSHDEEEETEHFTDELKKRRLRWRDCVRALFTALAFLAFAASQAGIQECFFPQAGMDIKQGLTFTPPIMALISSFVFAVFPTTRKSKDFLNNDGSGGVTPDPRKRARDEDDEEAARLGGLEDKPRRYVKIRRLRTKVQVKNPGETLNNHSFSELKLDKSSTGWEHNIAYDQRLKIATADKESVGIRVPPVRAAQTWEHEDLEMTFHSTSEPNLLQPRANMM